jgi:hypothetical protein
MTINQQLRNIAGEYLSFYTSIVTGSTIKGDIDAASYGLDQIKILSTILEKSEISSLTIQDVRTINSLAANLTRGVEYFRDYEI